MSMNSCIPISHPEIQSLATQFSLHPAIVAAKVGVWQTSKGISDRFPNPTEFTAILGPVQATAGSDNELVMSKAEMFKELGRSVPKKTLSSKEVVLLRNLISRTNNDLKRRGVDKVFRLEQPKQVGQSDNFTWEVKVYRGELDTEAKKERLQGGRLDSNKGPSLLEQGVDQLLELSKNTQTQKEINISYGNDKIFRQNLKKAESQSNKLRWTALSSAIPHLEARIIQSLKRPTTIKRNIGGLFQGGVWGTGRRIDSLQDLADMYIIHRSPLIEKLHFVYLKDKVVVGTLAYTAGLVNRTAHFRSDEFVANYKSLGADEVYILHNHPSGNHLASGRDREMTTDIFTTLKDQVNFKGQLVIDTDKFSFISPKGAVDELEYAYKPDKLTKTRISLGGTQAQITNSLVSIGNLLLKNEKINAVIYVSTTGDIVGYDGFTNEDVSGIDFIKRMREIGAVNYALFSPDLESLRIANKRTDKHYSERVAFYLEGDQVKGLDQYNHNILAITTDLPGNEVRMWEGSANREVTLQDNIKNTLLGLNSITDGDKNNTPRTARVNTRVLTASLAGTLADPKKVLFGSLSRTQAGNSFKPERNLFENSTIEKFSGRGFSEILNSGKHSKDEQLLYIGARLIQSVYKNNLNRSVLSAIHDRFEIRPEEHPVRIIKDSNNTADLFTVGNTLYINLEEALWQRFKIAEYNKVNLDNLTDTAIFEELIHIASVNMPIPGSQADALTELFGRPELLNTAYQHYTGTGTQSDLTKADINNWNTPESMEALNISLEYQRALVQHYVLGETSEELLHPQPATPRLKGVWKFLLDVFENHKLPNNEIVVEQIKELIREGLVNDFEENINRGQTSLTFGDTESNHAESIIRKYANILKEQTGVDYEMISPEQAVEITQNSVNPWNGQTAFFYGNKVYFIQGHIRPDDVLHEFCHPIIRGIARQNRPLFTSLYEKLTQTDEGRRVLEDVRALYPDLTENLDDFKEEVLVRGLAMKQDKNLQTTSAFEKFINDLLYAIKQFLRQHFGKKIKVSDLEADTTLEELSKMLEEGGMFDLDPEVITDTELVAYKNEYTQQLDKLTAQNLDVKQVEGLVNKYFDTVSKHLQNVRKRKDLKGALDILENKYKTGELQVMKKNLKSYQTLILQDSKKMEDEVELTKERVLAVINSLGNVDNMTVQILEGLREIVKDTDNQDNIQRALYYQKVLKYWGDFTNEANRVLEYNGVRNLKMVDNVNANVRRANDLLEDFYQRAAKDVLWNKLKGTVENIDRKWQERIADLKKKNAPESVIAKTVEDSKKERITPENLEKALKGELKDVNPLGSFLEGYGYNPDPVVGGLARFVKDQLARTEVQAQAMFNNAAQSLKPLLDKVGYNPNKPGEIGERIGQKEKIGHTNPETGEFEEKEIWRFMNEFTGADLVRDQYLYKIKKASEKYQASHLEEDKKALASLQLEWETHRREFFHNEYTEDFYKVWDILRKDAIGEMARMRMNALYDDLNQISGQLASASAEEVLDIAEQVEVVRRKIKQLSSLYDEVGREKTGDDLEVAGRLGEFNKALSELYENVDVPNALQNAYNAYAQKLDFEGYKGLDKDEMLKKWLESNTRVVITDAFWSKREKIYEAINEVMVNLPQMEEIQKQLEEGYKTLHSLLKGSRDEDGQPEGGEMTPEKQQAIKDAQGIIDEAREKLNRTSGLPKHEQEEKFALLAKAAKNRGLGREDAARLNEILNKENAFGLSRELRVELESLFNELDELQSKEPTDSYVETVNNILSGMDSEQVYDILGALSLTKDTVGKLANDDIAQSLKVIASTFEDWFDRNHIPKEKVDWETQESNLYWSRTPAWSVIKPRDSKYYHTSQLKNYKGEDMTIGMPGLKYYKRLVKEQYLTKKIEGATVDNKGRWLPKTLLGGAKDDRYANKDYQRLKTSDPSLFQLLETVKALHLKNQEGLGDRYKLGLDMPRFRKQTTERLQSSGAVQRVIDKAKTYFTAIKDGWDQGDFNFDVNKQLISLDLFDDESSSVPIMGLSDLPISEISTDAMYTVLRYGFSALRNKGLSEISPIAKMIQEVVNNKKNYPIDSKILNNNTILYPGKKKDKYLRAKAVNNFIDTIFEGEVNTGVGADSALAQNFSRLLFKTASGAFLNLNIPSALKNAASMKFQFIVEGAAGRYMSNKDFLSSESWATNVTMKISSEVYKQGPKSMDIQLVELFDPERDRFGNHFGEALTRTKGKDYSYNILHRLTDFRKWVQLQASLQTFAGMMKHQKVTKDGKEIPYLEAWEVKDGKIRLKAGIDSSWGVSYDEKGEIVFGEKFLSKRNEMQRVLDNLNGAMGRIDKPEAERYLFYRYVSFFRRYLTSMLTNRFAKNRPDYSLENYKEGYYRTFVKLIAEAFKTGGKNLKYATPDQKAASIKLLTEAGTLLLMRYLLVPLLFGYDDDDKDRYAKLRQKSDVLPFLFAHDDPTRDFDLGGWLSNHALLQTLQIYGENASFLPFPGLGLQSYKQLLDIKSLVGVPTYDVAFNLAQDVAYLVSGNDKAYYQRNSGPLEFQQEGELKVWAHLSKAIGFTGSTLSPDQTIKNYMNAQSR